MTDPAKALDIVAKARRAIAEREGLAAKPNGAVPPAARELRANGHAGRRLERKPIGQQAFTGTESTSGLQMTCVADVEPRPIEWLWTGRLAIGKLTLIGGNPNAGKSGIACDISARVSRPIPWPDGSGTPRPGTVLILSAEDAVDDTIRPRLEAAGAELRRCHVIGAVRENGSERSFNLQDDLARLRHAVAERGDVRLVIIDPITSYMGGNVDSHRTTDVRGVIEPLARFADEMRVAVLAITHPPKAAHGPAINAFTGSLAYVAAARIAFIAIEEPDSERRLLLPVKNNIAAMPAGLGYGVNVVELPSGIEAVRVAWDGLPVTMTATEAIRAADKSASRDKLADAKSFLRQQLANGPVDVNEIMRVAGEWEIAEKTIRRAQKKLGIVAEKIGFRDGWAWHLPESEAD